MAWGLIGLFCPPRTSPIIPLAPGWGQSSDCCAQAPPCQGPFLPGPAPPSHAAQPDLLVPHPRCSAGVKRSGGGGEAEAWTTAADCQTRASPARPAGGGAALCTPTGPAPSGGSFLGVCSPDLLPPSPLWVWEPGNCRAAGLLPARGPWAAVPTASGFLWARVPVESLMTPPPPPVFTHDSDCPARKYLSPFKRPLSSALT